MSPQQPKSWKPDRPTSRGATAYHEAVVNAVYYIESLQELVKIFRKKIRENDTVVDFGAGTGVSALELIRNLKIRFKLWLVDNSAAWLGKAYEIFRNNPNIKCFLLEKIKNRYQTLSGAVGEGVVDHVISANTVHLIPNLEETFSGINNSLKPGGTFKFYSANILRDSKQEGVILVDNTIISVHDIALDIVNNNNKFKKYRGGLEERIATLKKQRKFIFPNPIPVKVYLKKLKSTGFKCIESYYTLNKIRYKDWLNFLRVKRLQAGILPEIGGKDPSTEEVKDRDEIITLAANLLFNKLKNENPMADDNSFTVDTNYFSAIKSI